MFAEPFANNEGGRDIQQGEFISLLPRFQNKEIKLKWLMFQDRCQFNK
jgi:hypothetical protein